MADIPKGGSAKPKPKPKSQPKPKADATNRGVLNSAGKGNRDAGPDKGGDADKAPAGDDYRPGATADDVPDIDGSRGALVRSRTPDRNDGGDGEAEGEAEASQPKSPNQGALLDDANSPEAAAEEPDPSERPKTPVEKAKAKLRRARRFWLFLKIFLPAFTLIVAVAWLSSCVSSFFGFGVAGIDSVSKSDLNSIKAEDGKIRRDVIQDGEQSTMEWDDNQAQKFAEELGSHIEPKNKDGESGDKESEANGWREVILKRARQIIGSGYSWSGYNWTGSTSTSWFTCSGVVDYAFGWGSRSHSPETLKDACQGWTTDISTLQPGDLVFYACLGRSPGHVGIYIGDNQVIDAIEDGGVKIRAADYMTPMGGGTFKEFGPEIEAEIQAAEARAAGNGGTINDGTLTENQQKVINAAKSVGSPGPGLCAGWVSSVFAASGVTTFYGNACDQYDDWCHSSNKSDLKPGMIVAIRQHSATEMGAIYGHVGIYVGGGMLMDNVGEIRTISVDEWIDYYNGYSMGHQVQWGWGGGVALA